MKTFWVLLWELSAKEPQTVDIYLLVNSDNAFVLNEKAQ